MGAPPALVATPPACWPHHQPTGVPPASRRPADARSRAPRRILVSNPRAAAFISRPRRPAPPRRLLALAGRSRVGGEAQRCWAPSPSPAAEARVPVDGRDAAEGLGAAGATALAVVGPSAANVTSEESSALKNGGTPRTAAMFPMVRLRCVVVRLQAKPDVLVCRHWKGRPEGQIRRCRPSPLGSSDQESPRCHRRWCSVDSRYSGQEDGEVAPLVV
ncbi:hypothetical protein SETIT_4G142200v2 [Setaria italica]|uniref:Uncharacterized protein n=1 Tax=Setaria italica TaxID=4555 RepID=A0A368QU79_SETIT|nr:hypothetical protein SETIT_4G142200v2 [Setaria italica]